MNIFFLLNGGSIIVAENTAITKSESLVGLSDIVVNGSWLAIAIGISVGLWIWLKKRMVALPPYQMVKQQQPRIELQPNLEVETSLPDNPDNTDQPWSLPVLTKQKENFEQIKSLNFVANETNSPLTSAASLALTNLDQAYTLREGKKYSTYYRTISEIVKIYLSDHFDLKLVNSSTFQLLSSLPDSIVDHAGEVVRMCDMIEFAKHQPTQSELEIIYQNSKSLIEKADCLISNL